MNHRSKYQIQYYKTFRRNFCDLTLVKDFLDMTPEAQFMKDKNKNEIDFTRI